MTRLLGLVNYRLHITRGFARSLPPPAASEVRAHSSFLDLITLPFSDPPGSLVPDAFHLAHRLPRRPGKKRRPVVSVSRWLQACKVKWFYESQRVNARIDLSDNFGNSSIAIFHIEIRSSRKLENLFKRYKFVKHILK